jgi:protoporphyrinogen oxidase
MGAVPAREPGGPPQASPEARHVVVVGAGFAGLAAAYELVRRGHRPIVIEAEAEVGGLAASFTMGDLRVERFYHHWFTHDRAVMELVEELGVGDRVVLHATRTGIYYANRRYRLSTPGDVLRFSALPIVDRLRLGLLVIRARRIKNWRKLDRISAAQWLRRLGGEAAFRVVWEPLLRGKFGSHAHEVSAAWFWAKLRLRGGSRGKREEERLAYFRGGFAALAEEMARYVKAGGGQVLLGRKATGLRVGSGRVAGVLTDAGEIAADAAILTPALPLIAEIMGPEAPPAFVRRLLGVGYLANVCAILELDRSLSDLYWTNVNDASFPFVGVIEHTNFDQADASGRRHIVYLSRYLSADDPLYDWPSERLLDFILPHLKRMFPSFEQSWIKSLHVWKARYAQPLVLCGYADLVPGHETPVPGVFIASMAQVYPEDRGTNYAIRDGRKVACMVDRWLRKHR